jgi:hypothetical protein
MAIYSYEMKNQVEEPQLENIIELFDRNGFTVNRDDSRKKGLYQGTYAYVKLDKELPRPFEFEGYDLMGRGFIARLGKDMVFLTLEYDADQIEKLKKELGYG